jgi:hypothetical protein
LNFNNEISTIFLEKPCMRAKYLFEMQLKYWRAIVHGACTPEDDGLQAVGNTDAMPDFSRNDAFFLRVWQRQVAHRPLCAPRNLCRVRMCRRNCVG